MVFGAKKLEELKLLKNGKRLGPTCHTLWQSSFSLDWAAMAVATLHMGNGCCASLPATL
uniref:Uncharacterized protein n=1 Tax=Arundo donax TaxID=35708 RepID=A0A0A9AF96_ARUDO